MTAAGAFPADATDQLVQANIVAANYNVARLAWRRRRQWQLRRDCRHSHRVRRRTPR